jgi:elongation factor G
MQTSGVSSVAVGLGAAADVLNLNNSSSGQKTRNLALVGHGHVGKTTLGDLLLFKAGITKKVGSVDDGTSLLDNDDEEKRHHFTLSSHTAHFDFQGLRFNLLDTPGYPDFLGQVIGPLSAVENAVIVLDAHKGIEVNTRRVWKLAGEMKLARFILINKCEAEHIDLPRLISQVQEQLGPMCLPFLLPNTTGSGFTSLVDVLEPTPDGRSVEGFEIDAIRTQILDLAFESDEELMERYLNDEAISIEEIDQAILQAVTSGAIVPIYCVSTKNDLGIDEFLMSVCKYAPDAGLLERHAVGPRGEDLTLLLTENQPLVAQVFKTRIDPFISRLSYVRIFSGKLSKDSLLYNPRTDRFFKANQIVDVQGSTYQPISTACAGEIVALVKVEDLQIGDTITDQPNSSRLPEMKYPNPMIGLAVEPKSRADQQKISTMLHKIEQEDPTFVVMRDDQTQEIVMRGLSEYHLSLIEERLTQREKVNIITHVPKIPYRESIMSTVEGSYRHKKQSGGSGQFAEVHLKVSPMPKNVRPSEYFNLDRFPHLRRYTYDADRNFAFVDRISGGSIPNQYLPAIEKGISEKMQEGVIAGFPMQDLCVEVFFGKDHPVDSNEAAFRTAARNCFKELATSASPMLLEPIVKIEIYVPDEYLGEVSGDLNSRRGRVEGMLPQPGGFQLITAKVPLSSVMTYSRILSSLTGGRGSFALEMSHYEQMPANEQHRLLVQK